MRKKIYLVESENFNRKGEEEKRNRKIETEMGQTKQKWGRN